MSIIILIALGLIGVVIALATRASELPTIHSRENYFFDGVQFSTQDFYGLVENGIRNRQIPNVSVSRIYLSESGLMSPKREYLRVSRQNHVFDICASPFGTGFFVSWWLGEKAEWTEKLPYVKKFKRGKTYYQFDTENMYKQGISACVNEALRMIEPSAKGIRALSNVEAAALKLT